MNTYNYNTIEDIKIANQLIKKKYGDTASLETFHYRKETRFHFVNISCIANYPAYGFKAVKSAMNALLAYENGVNKIDSVENDIENILRLFATAKAMLKKYENNSELLQKHMNATYVIQIIEKLKLICNK